MSDPFILILDLSFTDKSDPVNTVEATFLKTPSEIHYIFSSMEDAIDFISCFLPDVIIGTCPNMDAFEKALYAEVMQ